MAGPRTRHDVVEGAGNLDVNRLRTAILGLLSQRDPGKTICPSDAARAVAGASFRPLMPAARDAAAQLVREGVLEVTQGGDPVDPSTARGPIRLRLL